jgi:uncharacterized protein
MTEQTAAKPMTHDLTDEQVEQFLRAQPDFLARNPHLLEILTPPREEHGGNVVDFRGHMLDKLQQSLHGVRERYEGLIVASRDNMSTQSQVHEAVLGLVKSYNLEALLQMITQDLVRLFDVDVVRLAMESPVAEYYEAQYGEHNYSGVSFIDPGVVDGVMGPKDNITLIPDTEKQRSDGLSQIFADCAGLIRSCALLRLTLPSDNRQAILAFGVRHEDRFHHTQGVDLLNFLARIVEYKLDILLRREGLDVV